MLTVSHNGNESYIMYRDKIHEKNLENVLNQNVNVTKRGNFATFAISIVDNLSLL